MQVAPRGRQPCAVRSSTAASPGSAISSGLFTPKNVQHSLEMDVEVVDGEYVLAASWLLEPIVAKSFESAYFRAVNARFASKRRGR